MSAFQQTTMGVHSIRAITMHLSMQFGIQCICNVCSTSKGCLLLQSKPTAVCLHTIHHLAAIWHYTGAHSKLEQQTALL